MPNKKAVSNPANDDRHDEALEIHKDVPIRLKRAAAWYARGDKPATIQRRLGIGRSQWNSILKHPKFRDEVERLDKEITEGIVTGAVKDPLREYVKDLIPKAAETYKQIMSTRDPQVTKKLKKEVADSIMQYGLGSMRDTTAAGPMAVQINITSDHMKMLDAIEAKTFNPVPEECRPVASPSDATEVPG